MTIRFGVSPIAWINDDMPELGADTPLVKVLDEARELGFEGIELGGRFPREPRELAELLSGYGLSLIGGWYSTHLLDRSAAGEIAALRSHLELLEAMGSQVFIAAECSNAIHGQRATALTQQPHAGNWVQFGERLTTVADYVTGRGLRFAYHHHLGTVVQTQLDVESLMANTGTSVGLTVDTGHAALGEFDAQQFIRLHPNRVAHVHCKDVRRRVFADVMTTRRSFLDGVLAGMFTAPGDGDIEFKNIMTALADIGYSGWIVVEAEQDPAVADPRTYAALGLATLRRDARSAGLGTQEG
jgi:inosose dehydratase